MGLPEVVEFGRNFAVMVRVQGPDPKGLKMRRHAFHQYSSGRTTLSASGMLLPASVFDIHAAKGCFGDGDVSVVVTVASAVEQFLSAKYRQGFSQGLPELITGAQIDIMVEETKNSPEDKLAPKWLQAKLLKMIDVPQSSQALQSVFEASSSSPESEWEVGWSLASSTSAVQAVADTKLKVEQGSSNEVHVSDSCTKFAILGFLSTICKDLPDISISEADKRGDFLLSMGSPFGVLSPLHFLNSIATGSVANSYPLGSTQKTLLMADIRCLPGMEGGPIFNAKGQIIGILTRPLRQNISGAEVQLVIPWEAITRASNDFLSTKPQPQIPGSRNGYQKRSPKHSMENYMQDPGPSEVPISIDTELNFGSQLSLVDKAAASVCLITVNDGAWASGILLNTEGLILTNAHLLEPWRFGKSTVSGGRVGETSGTCILTESLSTSHQSGRENVSYFPLRERNVESPFRNKNIGYGFTSLARGYKKVRVRLGQQYPWIWSDAKIVYVSKGPLDVALLKLEYIPDELVPIDDDLICPSPGGKAYVIGHGLFGPRTGSAPSISVGVVAKVVKAKLNRTYSSMQEIKAVGMPVMLETTATVHPGCSGGAVVNSDGRMIGLVTSNSRHGGGTAIPHLNFSIPSSALEPIFKFAKDMQDMSLLHIFDKPNSQLSSIWSLAPPLSPKNQPSLPKFLLEEPNKDNNTRGSRFAKFIAERTDLSTISTDLDKVPKLPNNKIQSKL